MKKKFSFIYRISKKEVRDLKIITVYDEVTVTGEATRHLSTNPITERSEFVYSADIEAVIWRGKNVYAFMEMVAENELDNIQDAAYQHATTIFTPAKETAL